MRDTTEIAKAFGGEPMPAGVGGLMFYAEALERQVHQFANAVLDLTPNGREGVVVVIGYAESGFIERCFHVSHPKLLAEMLQETIDGGYMLEPCFRVAVLFPPLATARGG